jgi:hypothetical protein
VLLYIAREHVPKNRYNAVIPGKDVLKPAAVPLEEMKIILQVNNCRLFWE